MKETILLIEDNDDVREINREALSMHGFRTLEAETIAEGRALLARGGVDLILLDILLPDGSGLALCEELRGTSAVPVLFLSALGENDDIIRGLRAGGDDYLPKPYDLNVMIERVKAMLRRSRLMSEVIRDKALELGAAAGLIERGPLALDCAALVARVNGRNAMLTPREFALLLVLVRADGGVVPGRELYRVAWGQDADDDMRALRTQMSRLRGKLNAEGPDRFLIRADHARGYCLSMQRGK